MCMLVSKLGKVDLSIFKSFELTYGCVMVNSVFESRDSLDHSHRSMYQVSWDVDPK